MSELEKLIYRKNLEAWHEADQVTGVANGGSVSVVPDLSGRGRTLVCSTSNPTYAANVINGLPAIEFDGSQNALAYSGSFVMRYAVIVAAYADATFPATGGANEYAGLIAGINEASNGLLVANPSSTKWFNFGYSGYGSYIYRIRGVEHVESDLSAPMSNNLAVMEIIYPSGLGLDGIQIGHDRTFSNRKFKGRYLGSMFYSSVPLDQAITDIIEYWATKYLLWSRSSDGLDVWPFQPEWARPLPTAKPVLTSRSVSQTVKSRSKGPLKQAVSLTFTARSQDEYDAARAFWDQHYPGTPIIYRDEAFYPARDRRMFITSDLNAQNNGYNDIDYTLNLEEV